MSKPIERVEIITGRERRRRYTAEEKVRLVEETMQPGMTVSAVARLHGVSPSLLFGWRRRMTEGGLEAVRADEDVVAASRVRELEGDCQGFRVLPVMREGEEYPHGPTESSGDPGRDAGPAIVWRQRQHRL